MMVLLITPLKCLMKAVVVEAKLEKKKDGPYLVQIQLTSSLRTEFLIVQKPLSGRNIELKVIVYQ